MAVYYPLSFATRSEDMPKQVGATATANGQALIGDVVSGPFGVAVSTGAGTDKFVGFLSAQTSALPFAQSVGVQSETATLSVSGTYTLGKVPLGGTTLLYDVTAGAAVSSGSYTIDGSGNVTYVAGAGHSVYFVYQFTLSVSMARARFGDIQPGGYFGDTVGSWSVMRSGTIYTDQFDTSKSYEDATAIKLASGGKVTDHSGAGNAINANIVSIPSSTKPFLGLSFLSY